MKVAVVSGKGGSGKSSVTAALIALSERAVAVDCDVDASNLPLLFDHKVISQETFVSGSEVVVDVDSCIGCGLCVEKCAFDALRFSSAGQLETVDFSCEGCGLCVRVCPQHSLSMHNKGISEIYTSQYSKGIMVHGSLCPGDDNSGKMIARLREIADVKMEHMQAGLQILDGPPGIGCPVLSTVTGVDHIVLVVEPTLSGISDFQRVYRVAHCYCRAISVVINKCNLNDDNRKYIHGFCIANGVPVVAELPFERRMVEAQLHRTTIIDYAPESVCSKAMISAYHSILGPL